MFVSDFQLVDSCTRLLVFLINIWRSALGNCSMGTLLKSSAGGTSTLSTTTTTTPAQPSATTPSTVNSNSSGASSLNSSGVSSITQTTHATTVTENGKKHEQPMKTTIHFVEGFALVMLCNSRLYLRKLAVMILKEVKNLNRSLCLPENEPHLVDVIDKYCPQVLDKCLHMLPQVDRMAMLNANVIDLQWIADRSSGIWTTGNVEGDDSTTNIQTA